MDIAFYTAVGALVIVILLVLIVRKRLSSALEEVRSIYPEHVCIKLDRMANFFGQKSRGMKQVRGNGILVLTKTELYFRMLLPRRELSIPLESVTSIETPASFLGKTKGGRLLLVSYKGETGDDAAAWMVSNLEVWVEMLERTAGVDRTR